MIAWDARNSIWYVRQSDVPGLCVEAETFDQLRAVIADVAPDLLETNVDAIKRFWPIRIQHVREPRRRSAA